jgi:hypothetical protein
MPQEILQFKEIDTVEAIVRSYKVIKEPVRLNAADASIILGMLLDSTFKYTKFSSEAQWIQNVLINGSTEFRS